MLLLEICRELAETENKLIISKNDAIEGFLIFSIKFTTEIQDNFFPESLILYMKSTRKFGKRKTLLYQCFIEKINKK